MQKFWIWVMLLLPALCHAQSEKQKEVSVIKKWELPDELYEISAISWIDKDRLACVQDEKGSIYIYNLSNSAIEKEIPFTSAGDFEGIAIVHHDAYVMRSDATIFEVKNFLKSDTPVVVEHRTPFAKRPNFEGICYDKKNNRLLLVVKRKDPDAGDGRSVYEFPLKNKKIKNKPLLKIESSGKKGLQPSEIAIHPHTGQLYVLLGEHPGLLQVKYDGSVQQEITLDNSEFPLPEGLTFSPDGILYISSEGKGTRKGSIMQVKF